MVDIKPASETGLDDFEKSWDSIANSKLALRDSVHFYQHRYRGQDWLIIADQQDENYFRCQLNAMDFLQRLDGVHSVEQALQETQRVNSEHLSRQDVLLLIGNLHAAKLFLTSDIDEEKVSSSGLFSIFKNGAWLRPFAIKLSLFDPDSYLNKMLPYIRPLFSLPALLVWLVAVVSALVMSGLHWPELVEYGQARFSDPENLLWYWLIYPVIKALHELGHAFATRLWGGEVHDMGIMFLVFFPVPYVDSSAAHRINEKHRRILVSAAGIIVETFLASLAMFTWLNSDSGLMRDLAFDIMIIAGILTILFNANPLLKFDGYYIFSELIEIPSLATRANQYLGYLIKRYLLAIPQTQTPVTAASETNWLWVYGIASGIYRIFITFFIALWVAGKFFIVGMLLAIWAIVYQFLYPAIKHLLHVTQLCHRNQRLGRLGFVLVVLLGAVALVLLVPVKHSSYAEGIVSMPEDSLIRSGTDGVVLGIEVTEGSRVNAGLPLLRLENLQLDTRRDELLARLDETRARQKLTMLQDRNQAEIFRARITAIEAELRDVQNQLESLQLKSPRDGVVSWAGAEDLPGRYIRRGDIVGYVSDSTYMTARVVVSQTNIARVRRDTKNIQVRLKSHPERVLEARLIREQPQVSQHLPSRFLGSAGGGEIAIDVRDEKGLRTISSIYSLEIRLPSVPGMFVGQRVYVRFNHTDASVGRRIVEYLNGMMLKANSF